MRTNLSLELTSPSTSMHLRIYQQRKTSAHHLGPWKVLGESFTVEMLTIVAWASPSSTYLLSSISQFHHHQFNHHCVISKTYRVGGDHIQALGSYLGPWSHFSQDEMNTRNVSSWNCGWYPHNSSVACLLDPPANGQAGTMAIRWSMSVRTWVGGGWAVGWVLIMIMMMSLWSYWSWS